MKGVLVDIVFLEFLSINEIISSCWMYVGNARALKFYWGRPGVNQARPFGLEDHLINLFEIRYLWVSIDIHRCRLNCFQCFRGKAAESS